MKRRREIILDFTSLLDVIMIILFFFVLYSQIDTQRAKEEIEVAKQEAAAHIAAAQQQEQLAAEQAKESAALLAELKDADERQAANLESILDFGKGMNLQLRLEANTSGFSLKPVCGKKALESIALTEDAAKELAALIASQGYTEQDTILAVFVYDASARDTASAYRQMQNTLRTLRKTYAHLYLSELDLSLT